MESFEHQESLVFVFSGCSRCRHVLLLEQGLHLVVLLPHLAVVLGQLLVLEVVLVGVLGFRGLRPGNDRLLNVRLNKLEMFRVRT